ncbi:MerR family transcriptional regulator [bacterium]|nr:MerR family transcriptional regulator [bacterium]
MARKARAKPPGEKLMKTSEVLERSGVTRQMLYLYSTMGLIEEVEMTAAGHRLYGKETLARLKIIRDALETGYSLKDVKEIFFEPTDRRGSGKK